VTVEIVVDGQRIEVTEGVSVAAALLGSGRRAWRSSVSGQPRGLFCGIGVCFECLSTVDGAAGVRTCVTAVAPGMRVETDGGTR
jgi:predicted molibdopterin-dependent oxidoreductase YjgC